MYVDTLINVRTYKYMCMYIYIYIYICKQKPIDKHVPGPHQRNTQWHTNI